MEVWVIIVVTFCTKKSLFLNMTLSMEVRVIIVVTFWNKKSLFQMYSRYGFLSVEVRVIIVVTFWNKKSANNGLSAWK